MTAPAEVPAALAACAREHLAAALDALFGVCRSQFFASASTAATPQEQARCLEFVRSLTRHRAAVTESILARVSGGLAALPAGAGGPPGTLREGELPLVESVDEARARFRTDLAAMRQRLGTLCGRSVDAADNPLDPVRLAEAFVEASVAFGAGREIMTGVCTLFDSHVLQALGPLYRRVNAILDEAAPQPVPHETAPAPTQGKPASPGAEESEWLDAFYRTGVDTSTSNPAAMSPAAAALFGTARVAGAGESQGIGAAGQEAALIAARPGSPGPADPLQALQEISGLLARLRGGVAQPLLAPVGPAGATAIAGPGAIGGARAGDGQQVVTLIPADQLAALLGELQSVPAATDGAPPVALDIRAALSAIAASRGNVGLARQDQDVLDIVTLFFDTVMEDRALPPAIQGLIARLQLPVVKLALVDRGFFGDRAHPARQLIDAVARAGVGWDSNTRATQDAYLAQIGAVIDELLVGGAPDAEAFAQALVKLNEHLQRAEQRAQKLERRSAEKAQAEARTAAARDAVHALLGAKLDGRELPQALLEFITCDWQRVLQLLFLRKGVDSPEWHDATRLVDDLARTAAAPAGPAGRAALEAELPAFYQRLEAGLEMTQGNTGEAQERVAVLREMYRARLAAPADAPVAVPSVQRVKIDPPPMVPPRAPRPAAVTAESAGVALTLESLKRVDELPLGTWLEYENPANRATRRLKLSARIEETRVFLFCDHLGNPVAEKPRKQFALELQSGLLRVIEDTPLVDRTMERIANALREQAGAG